MREQVPSKLTPEQGWAKMKPILDREMPVEKRKRRFLAFWWIAAGVFLIGMSGLSAWYTIAEKESTPNVNREIQPSIPQHQTPSPQVANGFAKHIPSAESNPNLNDKRNSSNSPESLPPPRSSNPALTNTSSIQNHQRGNPDVNDFTASNDNVKVSIDEKPKGEEKVTEIKLIPTETEIQSAAMRNGQVISPLPWSGVTLIDALANDEPVEGQMQFAIHHSPLTNHHSPFAFHPFATANVLAGFHGGGGGYVGTGVDVDILSRLDINLGFGYRTYDPQLSFLPQASRLDAVNNADLGAILQNDNNYPGIPEYIASESFSSSSSYLALNSIVETLHQWQLNLGVTYSFANRFYAEGGLAWDFGTKAKSQYPIISVDGALPTSNVRVSHSLDEYHLVRKAMTSWYGGLGYHIGRHFDVYGHVIFSFQPYLLTTDYSSLVTSGGEREDYINGMAVGVRYKL